MPHKRLLFEDEAREKVLRGAAALADAVRLTLGPKSKSVLIERKFGRPLVCDDGVTIAREIDLPDAEENLGAQALREAAERTGDAVGDGTTTATLLAHAIFADGVRNVTAGASAVVLKRGLARALRVATASLQSVARPVASLKEKVQVATISAHGDVTIGELVADALERVGGEGVVTVEEAKGMETALEVVNGMRFDRGYLSSYFVTDAQRMEVVLEEPYVLLHEKKITAMRDLLPLLEQVAKSGRPLLVVAEEVDGEALATLVVNKLRGTLACAAVRAPGFGDRRRAMLEDMAILTGGRLISEDVGLSLEHLTLDVLGRAKRVTITREHTTLIGGFAQPGAVDGRCADIRKQIADSTSDYDKEKLRERLAKLSG
ncbi:MAG TPA: chaperonin GroEL, partial [Gemmatimonadaceae bacterium]|nr:chaperonin GroEL [Gemmatimonadaceae bacterium]